MIIITISITIAVGRGGRREAGRRSGAEARRR